MLEQLPSAQENRVPENPASSDSLGRVQREEPPPQGGESAEPPGPLVDWKLAMKRAIRSSAELRRRLKLPPNNELGTAESFPTFVPLELLSRIQPGDPDDPILKQVLATTDENAVLTSFVADPVGDRDAEVALGLLKKYERRALMITTGACAIHCRYCFRREFPYEASSGIHERWASSLDYLRRDNSVEEVLLSGGDPLTLSDEKLEELIGQIESVPHVRRLRIHSRLPIAIPQRVNEEFVSILKASRLTTWFVIHCNHAAEIDEHVAEALGRLLQSGIPVLNQAVLLSGVNDSVTALADLSTELIDLGVQPYYLHQLDQVRGAHHFWVSEERGEELVNELREILPGYAVPRYVKEIPGRSGKTPIA